MLTLSKNKGTGGGIKRSPEDFVVKEITGKGVTLSPDIPYSPSDLREKPAEEGKFTTFVLQKRNWDTIKLLLAVAKRVRRGRKSIAYAGTKDREAISVQLASIYGAEPSEISEVRFKDMSINGAWRSNGITLGSNIGNAFDVTISSIDNAEPAEGTLNELNGHFPNYFGRQRFGQRLNNFRIGMHMLRNEYGPAAMEFLTGTSNENNEEARSARKQLSAEQDFAGALSYFPKHLKYEIMVLRSLAKETNYANALRALPRGISMMFIHAVEAYIFNASMERRIGENDLSSKMRCGCNFYGFPDIGHTAEEGAFSLGSLIGYETTASQISPYEEEVMLDIGIKPEDFKMRSMPELGMKGSLRPLLAPTKGLSSKLEKDSSMRISFSIPAGSYATVFINEITKSDVLSLEAIRSA